MIGGQTVWHTSYSYTAPIYALLVLALTIQLSFVAKMTTS